jgi:hypothetical protein
MRIVRVGTPPAVVRVRTRDELLVAVPEGLPAETVLALARLVLSTTELTQLQRRLQLDHGTGPSRRKGRKPDVSTLRAASTPAVRPENALTRKTSSRSR